MIELKPISFDAYYASLENVIVLNNLNPEDHKHMQLMEGNLMTTISSDILSLEPTCPCGATTKGVNMGVVCEECGGKVEDRFGNIDPVLWCRIPENMGGWIAPDFLATLGYVLNFKRSLVRWFGDRHYNPPSYSSIFEKRAYEKLKEIPGFERTYTWFAHNIRNIILQIILVCNKKDKVQELMLLLEYYEKYQSVLHSNYLPVFNKRFAVKEKNAMGNFISDAAPDLNNIARMFVSKVNTVEGKEMERLISKTLDMSISLYATTVSTFMGAKKGLIRKQLFGTRSPFAFRAVITPIPGKHDYDELHVPWGIGVTAFRPHLINILMRDPNKTYKQINKQLFTAIQSYDEEVSRALDTLIEESPFKGIPVLLQRNPSQGPQAAIRLFITKFKKDMSDKTISESGLVVGIKNGDFDGDEENAKIAEDLEMAEDMSLLAPENIIPYTDKQYGIFGKITTTKPVAITLGMKIRSEDGGNIH